MSRSLAISRSQTAKSAATAPSFGKTLVELWRTVARDLSGTYRPERHYMRGPGPKWHAKHAAVAVNHGDFHHIDLGGSLSAA